MQAQRTRRYRVMREHKDVGRMITASGDYVQRASAFKFAEKVARTWPEGKVTVWEYTGPGESEIHVVHDPERQA